MSRTEAAVDPARTGASLPEPRVALVCPGLGRERRGYERITADLHTALGQQGDITVFKGAGPRSRDQRVPWSLARDGWTLMHLPLHKLLGRTRYHVECLTFALSLAWPLARGHFDLVFTYDPPMLKLLWWLRRLTGARFRILFAHGGAFPFGYWPHADVALHCSPLSFDEDIAAGTPREKFALLPIGIWPERFEVQASRAELRRRHGVPESTLLMVAISALDRSQKRVHHLIEEVADLPGEVLLWIDGSPNFAADLTLIDLAAERLGARCRLSYGSSERVGELLAIADVMVLASVREGFGLAIVEAVCAGTPVLVHNSRHFDWLLGVPEMMVDMAEPGALRARLADLLLNPDSLRRFVDKQALRHRYAWPQLAPRYLDLFRRAARGESVCDV